MPSPRLDRVLDALAAASGDDQTAARSAERSRRGLARARRTVENDRSVVGESREHLVEHVAVGAPCGEDVHSRDDRGLVGDRGGVGSGVDSRVPRDARAEVEVRRVEVAVHDQRPAPPLGERGRHTECGGRLAAATFTASDCQHDAQWSRHRT